MTAGKAATMSIVSGSETASRQPGRQVRCDGYPAGPHRHRQRLQRQVSSPKPQNTRLQIATAAMIPGDQTKNLPNAPHPRVSGGDANPIRATVACEQLPQDSREVVVVVRVAALGVAIVGVEGAAVLAAGTARERVTAVVDVARHGRGRQRRGQCKESKVQGGLWTK